MVKETTNLVNICHGLVEAHNPSPDGSYHIGRSILGLPLLGPSDG